MSNDKPQVADAFGKGTHDALPGELRRIAVSDTHTARGYLLSAISALDAASLRGPADDLRDNVAELTQLLEALK